MCHLLILAVQKGFNFPTFQTDNPYTGSIIYDTIKKLIIRALTFEPLAFVARESPCSGCLTRVISSNRSICNTNIVLVELLFISFICVYIHWFLYLSHAFITSCHSVIPSDPQPMLRPWQRSARAHVVLWAPPWHWRTKGEGIPSGPTTQEIKRRYQKWPYLSKICHLFTFSLNIILGIHVRFLGYKGSFPNYPAKKKHIYTRRFHMLFFTSGCPTAIQSKTKYTGRVHLIVFHTNFARMNWNVHCLMFYYNVPLYLTGKRYWTIMHKTSRSTSHVNTCNLYS